MVEHRIAEPILVTGATGFIGRRLVQRLLDDGHSARALVLPGDVAPAQWGDRVELFVGDVTRRASIATAIKNAATVFHLAAMVGDWGRDEDHQRVTVLGTENVLGEAARNSARVLLASSVVVYGQHIGRAVCDEELPMGRPQGIYSRSKQEQERIARRLEANRSLKVTIVRPTNVYGPGSEPWVNTPIEVMRSRMPALIGHGRRDAGLTFVDNVVDVFVRAAQRAESIGRVYNASDDNGITWLRYFTELADLAGCPRPRALNRKVASVAAIAAEAGYRVLRRTERPPITREALNLVGSHHRVPILKAQTELGYRPLVNHNEAMVAIAKALGQR